MTAALSAGSPLGDLAVRPFDSGRDLVALADLIETGFGENLDVAGRGLVQSLRLLGRAGRLGGVLSRWLLPPAANPQGYVWEENGQVLGNASLLPVTGYSKRWVMANVAVQPEHRQRGIGRSLVVASIEHARSRGAQEIVLQVDEGNSAAIGLYLSLGFIQSSARTTWTGRVAPIGTGMPSSAQVRRREPADWRMHWELACRIHPEGVQWPFPNRIDMYRPAAWQKRVGLGMDQHWVWEQDGTLLGAVSLRQGIESGQQKMILLVNADSRGIIEEHLIDGALRHIRRGHVVLEYPVGMAEDVIRRHGFVEQRKLVWMAKSL